MLDEKKQNECLSFTRLFERSESGQMLSETERNLLDEHGGSCKICCAPHVVLAQDHELNSSQEQQQEITDSQAAPENDQTMFYAFLQGDSGNSGGAIYDFFRDKPLVREIIGAHNNVERKFRPMLQ